MILVDIMGAIRARFWLLFRYGIAGTFGAFVQTFSLYTWISLLGLHETYLLGAFFGFCLALATTFLLQKYWTFRDHTTHRTHKQLFWYSVVAVVNVSINIALLVLAKEIFFLAGIDFFNGWYIVIQAGIVIFSSGVSFLINYFFTFRGMVESLEESLESSPRV